MQSISKLRPNATPTQIVILLQTSIPTDLSASLKSGISSAAFATFAHLTTPSPSTAKLPDVCQRLPLSVGLFH
jgi:hypothetical protein